MISKTSNTGAKKYSGKVQNDRDEFSFTCNRIPIDFNLSWYHPEKVRTTTIIGTKGMIFFGMKKQS